MEKLTAILANRVYCDDVITHEDVEVTLPDVAAQVFEVKAMGPVNVVLPGLFESMEMTIKTVGASRQYAQISSFKKHVFKITAAQNKVAADGTITPKKFRAVVNGISKKIGSITIKPGEAAEPESTYEVTRYEAYEDDQCMWIIDKLAGVCKVWDGAQLVDYGNQIKNLLDA